MNQQNIGDIPFDALVTLFLFLIGTPALIFQFASVDVRDVLMRKKSRLFWISLPALLGFGLTICAYLETRTSYHVLPLNLWIEPSAIWDITLFAMVVLSGLATVMVIASTNKQKLAMRLARGLRKKQSRNIGINDLESLALLGTESRGGEEKDWVLKALQEVVQDVVRSPHYDGARFEYLVNLLIEIVIDGRFQSTFENYQQAIGILREIVHAFTLVSQKPECDADLVSAIRALSILGQHAMNFPAAGISVGTLDILEDICSQLNPRASQAIREIGAHGLEKKNSTIAMKAVTLLLFMAHDVLHQPEIDLTSNSAINEVVFDYLGLLANFWVNGDSSQEVAGECYRELASIQGLSLKVAFETALEHHRTMNRFELADNLLVFGRAQGQLA